MTPESRVPRTALPCAAQCDEELSPTAVLAVAHEELRGCGLSNNKARLAEFCSRPTTRACAHLENIQLSNQKWTLKTLSSARR